MSETTQGDTPKTGCGDCACGGAGPVLTEFLKRMGPPEGAKRHFDQARVEFLKGVRALIDARIESLNPKEESRGAKVTVE
jgi:hypothetical protein